ncbi:MAG: flagellar hook-length control protein FliK [Vicinamibacterales bacterium]
MTIKAIPGSVLRVEAPAGGGNAAIPLGTPIELHVVGAAANGRWLVAVRGLTFSAEASVPLQPGAPVLVVANRSDRVLELRIISEPLRFDDEQYAAALLEQVRTIDAAPASRDARASLLRAAAMASDPLPSHLAKALAALVDGTAPLKWDEASGALVAGLKRHVAAFLPFEARFARGADRAGASLDVRVLVGQLIRALSMWPASDSDRSLLERSLSDVARSVVADQLASASDWLRAGTAVIRVPLEHPDGRTVDAQLRLYDREAKTTSGSQRPFRFDVRLTVPHLGALEACIAGRASELLVQVYVENPKAQPFIRAELDALTEGLQRAGFTRVSAQCAVDSTRFAAPVPTRSAPEPGTVLDARA